MCARPTFDSPVVVGRGFWLVQFTVQVPFTVLQEGPTEPPAPGPRSMKVTGVPSGTGLPKRSARNTVIASVTPSWFHPSTFSLAGPAEKDICVGMPLWIVNCPEVVWITGLLVP